MMIFVVIIVVVGFVRILLPTDCVWLVLEMPRMIQGCVCCCVLCLFPLLGLCRRILLSLARIVRQCHDLFEYRKTHQQTRGVKRHRLRCVVFVYIVIVCVCVFVLMCVGGVRFQKICLASVNTQLIVFAVRNKWSVTLDSMHFREWERGILLLAFWIWIWQSYFFY